MIQSTGRNYSIRDFERLQREADAVGLRLEFVGGIPVFEASPNASHQQIILRIQTSIRPKVLGDAACQCAHAADVNIRFPDGSRKRPDISVWCRVPDEQDTEVTLLPEAVVEVISKDYAAKDLVIGVPFYQRIGIPDIIVFDPDTNEVRHWRNGGNEKTYQSPVTLDLLCGCTITV